MSNEIEPRRFKTSNFLTSIQRSDDGFFIIDDAGREFFLSDELIREMNELVPEAV